MSCFPIIDIYIYIDREKKKKKNNNPCGIQTDPFPFLGNCPVNYTENIQRVYKHIQT